MCVCVCVCVCGVRACVCVCVWRECAGVCVFFHIIPYENCFNGRTVLCMCIEYCIQVNISDVSAQGVDECIIHVHHYYYYY